MSDPTDADRQTAAEMLDEVGLPHDPRAWRLINTIAAALAAEREKARAPFLALADRWEAMAATVEGTWDAVTIRSHADHIRRAAEDTP